MIARQRITQLRSTDLPYLGLLFICCIIAYWPISFFVYSLKNDALNYFLPVRYQVSEAIANGHWPFWSPYFNLGYPLHADMQSGVWNPIVQIFSLFGPYTLRTLQYETLLYVFISGVGMFYLVKYFAIANGHWPFWSPYFNLGYPLHGDMQSGVWNPIVQIFSLFGPYTLRSLQYETLLYIFISGVGMFYLVKYFAIDKKICLLVGASYMLCGYNSDSAQFLNWISSASFLPLVILFSFRSVNELSLRASLLCGLFIYLFFATAYPADFVILLYLLIAFFTWQAVQKKAFKKQNRWLFLKRLFVIGLVSILLSLPAILSYIQSLPLTERGYGTSYNLAMSNPFHPLLFFTYLTPLPAWKASFVSITDPLERNSYFGLITLAFFVGGLFLKTDDKWLRFCKWGFIISAVFSLGEIGGLRVFAYYALPLMNTFRHPANAKLFSIFFACNLAAITIQQFKFSLNKKLLRYSSFAIGAVLITLFIVSFFGHINLFTRNFFSDANFSDEVKSFLDNASFSDFLFLNSILQIPFLVILYLFAKKKIGLKVLMCAGLLNLVLHTILYTPFTVIKNSRAGYIQTLIDKNTINSYTLDLNSSVEQNSENGTKLFKEIGALNMYNKKIGRIDYRISPSNLNSQNAFWNDNPKLRNYLIKYPLLYKADVVLPTIDSSKVFSLVNQNVILANDTTGLTGSGSSSKSYNAVLKTFSPNRMDVVIKSLEAGTYCLFQNYYPNWKLYIDGKEETIIPCNVSFMGFKLDKGKHTVSFQYTPTLIKLAFFVSLISLLTLLFFIAKKPLN